MMSGIERAPNATVGAGDHLTAMTGEERALRDRIETLRARIADVSAEYEEIKATLSAFEIRYDARVGVLLVELDRAHLELARVRRKIEFASEDDMDFTAVEAAIELEFSSEQRRVEREHREASGSRLLSHDLPDPPPVDVAAEIRTRYRRLARRFHPDVAISDEQRVTNQQVMARINAAMERFDIDELSVLEATLPTSQNDIPVGSGRARLQWATSEVGRLETILARASGRLAAARTTSVYDLWDRCQRDPSLLDRLERDIRSELALARMELRAEESRLESLLKERTLRVHDVSNGP